MTDINAINASCADNKIDVLKKLVEFNGDECVNWQDSNSVTPLQTAAGNGFTEICKYLFIKGAKLDTPNAEGRSAFYLAAQNGHQETADWIYSQGATMTDEIQQLLHEGQTAGAEEVELRALTPVEEAQAAAAANSTSAEQPPNEEAPAAPEEADAPTANNAEEAPAATAEETPEEAEDNAAAPEQEAQPTEEAPVAEPAEEETQQQQQQEPVQAAAEVEQQQQQQGGVTSDDVSWEYGDHYFTKADVVDVTKIQAQYRRKAARKRVEEARNYKQRMAEEEEKRRNARMKRIELPDDSEIMAPSAASPTAAAAADGENNSAQPQSGQTTGMRGGFTVDYTKPLNRTEMSAESKGMQQMYSRMLKTKLWW